MIKRIIVIGGGTAGWIVANCLRSFTLDNIEVCLLESDKLPTVGVGEGTTSHFWAFLNRWCPWLNENEFIKETNATFKIGSRFEDWRGPGSVYTTPNDNIGHPAESNNYWPPGFDALRAYAVANGLSSNPSIQSRLMDGMKSPYAFGRSTGHAYHFDALLALKYFQSRAEAAKINRIIGTVVNADIEDSGKVTALNLDDGRKIEGDLFFDCTGFLRLFPKIFGVKFISWKDYIFVNRAINFPIPIKEDEPIPTHTLSKAMPNGWFWKVPTYSRYGAGYIYGSDFISTDEAFSTLQQEYGADRYLQEIKFETGYLEKGWVNNVMFSGLCAGFVEPMEATSLHSSICNLLVFMKDYFRPDMDIMDTTLHNRYNDLYWTPYWESVRDWIIMHYLGGREDTEFWRTIKHMKLPDGLQNKLDLWKHRLPRINETNHMEQVWQHTLVYGVLYGLGHLDKELAKKELKYYDLEDAGKELYTKYSNLAQEVYKGSIDHKQHLNDIRNGSYQ